MLNTFWWSSILGNMFIASFDISLLLIVSISVLWSITHRSFERSVYEHMCNDVSPIPLIRHKQYALCSERLNFHYSQRLNKGLNVHRWPIDRCRYHFPRINTSPVLMIADFKRAVLCPSISHYLSFTETGNLSFTFLRNPLVSMVTISALHMSVKISCKASHWDIHVLTIAGKPCLTQSCINVEAPMESSTT